MNNKFVPFLRKGFTYRMYFNPVFFFLDESEIVREEVFVRIE